MNATREDVAVALVKAMGYTPDNLQDPNILDESSADAASVSPNLKNYVALAVEKRLINGYPDGTFQLDSSITRAEVATLLYRAIKSATTDGKTEIQLNVSAPDITSRGTVYSSGTVTKGATVTINDQPVRWFRGLLKKNIRLTRRNLSVRGGCKNTWW